MESKNYNQWRAMLAIARASFRSITRSPSAVVFTIAFPLIFIIVFGFIGRGPISIRLGIHPSSDTLNQIYDVLRSRPEVILVHEPLADEMTQLQKGKLAGILRIHRGIGDEPLVLELQTSKAGRETGAIARMFLEHATDKANLGSNPSIHKVAELRTEEVHTRDFTSIDFILPGMLGFSLLSAGVFGTAFVFFNLRNTLVLKRFFATPIRRTYIVLGEGLSRVTFSTLTSSFLIILGHYAFGFTLVNGFATFLMMLLLAFFGLFVFMGFGFIVSSVAPNESTIPVLANIITLPQFLMAGTFFPTEVFPSWLQPICKVLPLTYLNDAMRKVAFEGATLADLGHQLGVIGLWAVLVYAAAIKVFRWE